MIRVKIADFVIELDNKYDFVEKLCKNYITDETCVDFRVSCTQEELDREKQAAGTGFSDGYIESLCIYRSICTKILEKDAFLVHSAVIEVDGSAYAFLARSGTGKSTHIALWRRALGENVKIVNGDKPIYRYIDGDLYAYGTPWCGKEGWNRNVRAKLKALCYIERAEKNSIERLPPQDSAIRIMKQILIPSDAQGATKTLELVDRMLNDIDSWLLKCNISSEAALIAYNAMSKE